MKDTLNILVRDYGWIHTGLGAVGNLTFLVGSFLFLPAWDAYQTVGVWLFIIGAALMLLGSLGDLLVKLLESRGKGKWREKSAPESPIDPIGGKG